MKDVKCREDLVLVNVYYKAAKERIRELSEQLRSFNERLCLLEEYLGLEYKCEYIQGHRKKDARKPANKNKP